MAMIYVKTREGKRAFFEGRVIPSDKFVPVPDVHYIRRLINRWDDLEVEGTSKKPKKPAEPKPVTV